MSTYLYRGEWEVHKQTVLCEGIKTVSTNSNLTNAKRTKRDEFYTRIEDVEREMSYYRKYFKGKTVLCNCDDPRISAFYRYFVDSFEFLGLKKLITTCYKSKDKDRFSRYDSEKAVWLEYTGGASGGVGADPEKIGLHEFEGDGDFRSPECVELLKQADIVVTNPPFSLFTEYISQLLEYDKKFIVLGNKNAVKYKEVFPLFQENKMWFGVNSNMSLFGVPDDYYVSRDRLVVENGKRYIKMAGLTRWYTNLDHKNRHGDIALMKRYRDEPWLYPKYDNYDAINVDKTAWIPEDYYGVMGVPISFMDRYHPKQFEIVGIAIRWANKYRTKVYGPDVERHNNLNGAPVLVVDGKYKPLYTRILIRQKKHQSV